MKQTINKLSLGVLLALSGASANAAYTIDLNDQDSLTFGGYIQADFRYTDGDMVPYLNDFWIGSAAKGDISQTHFSIGSTRLNTKYVHGDTMGFVELDFYTAEGNEVLTNSRGPRVRHAFLKHGNWTIGQTWSTFMNTGALAEGVDFGGPLVVSAFVRQTQIRYTSGNFQFALENPETYGGDATQDTMPDVVGKYTFAGDWGTVSLAGVFRQFNTAGGETETGAGFGASGKVKVGEKDDFRFQVHTGNVGRYVGAAAATDLAGEEVESATSIMVAYRHIWNDEYRSNVYYGNTTTDETDRDRTHWGVNVFKTIDKHLSYGLELGGYEQADASDATSGDSTYLQFSVKYGL